MNNELIKVSFENERITTSARALWEGLDRPYRDFTPWFDRYKDYGFIEAEDYKALSTKIVTAQGNEMEVSDYEITLDMAKQLAMLQKTEKGKLYRHYFLDLERKWNSPEYVMKRALEMANVKCMELEERNNRLSLDNKQKEEVIITMQPKVDYHDTVLNSNILKTTTSIAKDLGMTAKKLNTILENMGIQYKQSKTWFLKADYQHLVPEYCDYHIHEYGQSLKWTEKGRKYLMGILEDNEYIFRITTN